MPANEFEKKVQVTMEGLKLDPSEGVWLEVEQRIRKEKKRRRFLFILLLPLLLVGVIVSIIGVNRPGKKNEILIANNDSQDIKSNKHDVTATGENMNVTTADSAGINISREKEITNLQSDKATDPRGQGEKRIIVVQDRLQLPLKTRRGSHKEKTFSKITNEKENADSTTVIQKKANTTVANEPPGKVQDNNVALNPIPPVLDKKKVETVSQSPADSVKPGTDPITEPKIIASKDKKTKTKEWGLVLQGGVSQTAKGFHLFNSRVYENTYSFGGPGFTPSQRSPTRPGLSFSTGVYLRQPVSKRLAINSSLTYSYLSTRLKVGERVDTSGVITNSDSRGRVVTNFYRATGANSTISNQYHFFSLSSEISWKIVDRDKFTLYWDNGLSFRRLFASRVQHFDLVFRGYYKDPSLLNRNHLFISTGLSFPVSRRMTLNPFAEYSLTRVLKTNDSLKTHFSIYGLRLRYSIGNKK